MEGGPTFKGRGREGRGERRGEGRRWERGEPCSSKNSLKYALVADRIFCRAIASTKEYTCVGSCNNVVENCSFPYTYNGGLFYGCTNNMTGVSTYDQPFACIAVNATPVVCSSPGDPDTLLTNLAIYVYCVICELEAH